MEENPKNLSVRWDKQAKLLDLAHVMIRNIKDEIIFWNTGAKNLYGWEKEEALGKISHSLLQTKFSEPIEDIKSALRIKGWWEGELVHRRKDGTLLTVASHWELYRDQEGAAGGDSGGKQ